jgi:hypothetical protein
MEENGINKRSNEGAGKENEVKAQAKKQLEVE